jgi:hypothetical protein
MVATQVSLSKVSNKPNQQPNVVPFSVQIDLLPVVFAGENLLGPTPTFDLTRKKGKNLRERAQV